jgi:hypothetical protein
MMPLIQSPAYPGKYQDRFTDCQQQLYRPMTDLVLEACRAGWSVVEVVTAMIEVADNLMLAAADTDEVNEMLKRLNDRRI